MSRPLSQLIYTRIQDIPASPRIITLHRHNQFAPDVKGYGLAAAPDGRVIGLESFKGLFVAREIVGYTWYLGPELQPSPIFFGENLAEIERFLWDEIDRQQTDRAELPFLVGVGQGGIMALAAAAAVPDLLSGVIAIEACLPVVGGWTPPLAPLDGLPILIVDPPQVPEGDGIISGQALADTFSAWGGTVTREIAPAGEVPAELLGRWTSEQPIRYRTTA
jgi:pimeloyl-ACP methyl ester carboxylesterase